MQINVGAEEGVIDVDILREQVYTKKCWGESLHDALEVSFRDAWTIAALLTWWEKILKHYAKKSFNPVCSLFASAKYCTHAIKISLLVDLMSFLITITLT